MIFGYVNTEVFTFNFLASLINGNTLTLRNYTLNPQKTFNFLASLINGNAGADTHPTRKTRATFNFLASLINGNEYIQCAVKLFQLNLLTS